MERPLPPGPEVLFPLPEFVVSIYDCSQCLLTDPNWYSRCGEPPLKLGCATNPCLVVPFSFSRHTPSLQVIRIFSRSVPWLQKYVVMPLEPEVIHRGCV